MQCSLRTGNKSHEFDPGQWLSEDNSKVTINTDAGNAVFGHGPRSCTGKNLALTELTLTFVRSLYLYRRSSVQEAPKKLDHEFLVPG